MQASIELLDNAMNPSSLSRRHTTDFPKTETGLAEWTSRIKAMQAQVDADEEAEQKRLEEEIVASRLARLRRSHGIASGSRLDLGTEKEETQISEDYRPTAGRHKGQAAALRKLTGTSPMHGSLSQANSPLSGTAITSHPDRISKSPAPIPPPKSEPVSLAAFMGGRAAGPKLNKHAPQQDAHDPTLFEQHARVSKPHPVFGKGGVAIPGMATKSSPAPITGLSSTFGNQYRNATSPPQPSDNREVQKERTPAVPLARRSSEAPESHAGPDPKRMNGHGVRERTMSTPDSLPLVKLGSAKARGSQLDSPSQPPSHTSLAEVRPAPSSHASSSRTKALAAASTPASRPITSRQQTLPVTPSATPPRNFTASTPSLARPIQPSPKPSPQAPHIPVSQNPSPAFLRVAAPKDMTPSLSRLQGRGFVQNMIKVSSQLEASTSSPSSDKSPSPGGRRKSNVMERWQQIESSSATGSPCAPSAPPTPTPVRKSRTVDPTATARMDGVGEPKPTKLTPTSRSFEHYMAASNPQDNFGSPSDNRVPRRQSVEEEDATFLVAARSRKSSPLAAPSQEQTKSFRKPSPPIAPSDHPTPSGRCTPRRKSVSQADAILSEEGSGLGSAQTMISYIKPTKTGDDPVTSRPPSAPPQAEVDELGVRSSFARNSQGRGADSRTPAVMPSELPASSGQPLSHPTKDRAKKPKKAGSVRSEDPRSGTKLRSTSTSEADSHSGTPGTSAKEASPTRSHPNLLRPTQDPVYGPRATSPSLQNQLLNTRSTTRSEPQAVYVKNGASAKAPVQAESRNSTPTSNVLVGGVALPGLATSAALPPKSVPPPSQPELTERRALPGLTASLPQPISSGQTEEKSSPTAIRHTRIPSTGNRATVMEVAEALNSQVISEPPAVSHVPPPIAVEDTSAKAANLPVVPRTRHATPPAAQAERRKSNYEKYSAIILPPLKEELTPVSSPAGTLSRGVRASEVDNGANVSLALQSVGQKAVEQPLIAGPELTVSGQTAALLRMNHSDEPLPRVDIDHLIRPNAVKFSQDVDTLFISIDVMTIAGNTVSALTHDANVFYDTETLAIVYRSKSRNSGLVSTKVWGWRGKRSDSGVREEQKLHDLARRYGTSLEIVRQYAEPELLVHVLGGQMAIRQGTRAHWSSENTTMHLVRSRRGLVYIDEHDFNVRNLCSGHSYCLSILETMYVWHGCGSMEQERHAAVTYAQGLAGKDGKVVELKEKEDDEDDEMFWMMLGEDAYARADYWRWRPQAIWEPRLLRVDSSDRDPVQEIAAFLDLTAPRKNIFILDCVCEFFVLVGNDARKRRKDIRLAIDIAMRLSKRVANSRPYSPNVHIVILPSQLPLDLRVQFRGLDDDFVNNGEIPDHMNILTCEEALEHLGKGVWARDVLKDSTMLPLGLDPSDVP